VDARVLESLFLVLAGGALPILTGWLTDRRAAARERETRHDEYLWRRREEFEKLLADFIPVYERWSLFEGAQARNQFGMMADTTPEPEPYWVEDLRDEVNKFVAQLEVRSPSGAVDRALARATEAREAVWSALIFNNHVLLDGNREQQDDAFAEFMDKIEAFDESVRELSSTTSEDGRRQGSVQANVGLDKNLNG
jgi:cytochrome c556